MNEEWLFSAPEHGLLETDISSGSFNKAPWIPDARTSGEAATSYEQTRQRDTKKLVLSTAASDDCSLEALKIDKAEGIGLLSQRSRCSLCHASRTYYCYSCHVPLPETRALIPSIPELPIKIDIIKHPQEVDGKSTGIHAKVICPNSVRIFTFPDLPDVPEGSRTLLLFPDKSAKTLSDLAGSSGQGKSSFERVIVIDSTWSQSRKILSDPRISHLPKVIIGDRKTLFWRNQTGRDRDCLATIEAIYYLVSDYHRVMHGAYSGEYDNLLFFFKFMYDRLHSQQNK